MLIASGHLNDVIMDLGIPRRENHLKVQYGVIPHLDIVFNAIFEKDNILIDHCNRPNYHVARIGASLFAVKKNLPAPWLIHARYKL